MKVFFFAFHAEANPEVCVRACVHACGSDLVSVPLQCFTTCIWDTHTDCGNSIYLYVYIE